MKPLINLSQVILLAACIQFGFLQSATAGYESCDEQVYKCSTTYEHQCGYENVCHEVSGQRECHTTSPTNECHTVPGHQECHIVPGNRECHQEQQCRDSSPVCHTEQQCGTNALGEQICKDRQVCESGGQDCTSHEVCSGSDQQTQCNDTGSTQECGLVPGHEECYDSGSRTECSNEYRCSDQPRQTCGYETVHKTCYVPDPQPTPQPPYNPPYHPPVDDPDEPPYTPPTPVPHPTPHPTPQPPVVVPAPPAQPPVHPTPQPPPVQPPAPPVVVPAPVDPTVPGDNGSISVTDLNLEIKNNQYVAISLKDKGQNAKYDTRYFIAINNEANQRVINQFTRGNGLSTKQVVELQKALPTNQSYAISVKVVRTGGILAEDITFVISKKVIKK